MSNCREHPVSIRQSLAEHTRAAHETLHHHRWIARLVSPTLSLEHYHVVLSAYLQFYQHIERERARIGAFNSLSLHNAITQLEIDTAAARCRTSHQPHHSISVFLNSPGAAMGALYVLHGARFGAAILNKRVSKTLPQASRLFLQNATPISQWRKLTTAIESLGSDTTEQRQLFLSAEQTFSAFGESVTEFCESASTLA